MIGVNSQIQSESGGSDGVGFAIPSNTIRSVVGQIVAGKPVAHAYFGVQVRDSRSPLGAELAADPAGHAGGEGGTEGRRRRHEAGRDDDLERGRPVRGDRLQEARATR